MKRFLLLVLVVLGFISFTCQAQEVYLSVAMPCNSLLDNNTKTLLKNKILGMLTSQGVAATEFSAIAVVPEVSINDEKMIEGGQRNIYTQQLEVTFIIRNIITHTVFNSLSLTCNGEGYSKSEAIRSAIKRINGNSTNIVNFIATSKQKIYNYYNESTSLIINKANTLAAQQAYDEALAAAHESYNSADGFDCSDSGWVNKIWGEYGSFTFQNNGTALPSVVTQGIVKEGDKLYTAINSDNTLYADWYTSFDNTSITTKNGKEISLVLTGRQGSLDVDARPASGVQIGIWKDGAFEPLDGVKTGEDGKATFTVDLEPGEYILSAKGSVADIVDAEASWTLLKATKDKDGNDIYGKTDWTTNDAYIGYTEVDYGVGPYPWNEIQWIEDICCIAVMLPGTARSQRLMLS